MVRNPTKQPAFINLYTTYDCSSLHGFIEILYGNFEGTGGRTGNGRTEGQKDRCKPVYPNFFKVGA